MMHEVSRIGPYRIVGTLGEGGMGGVYRAVHCEPGEPAAVKTAGRLSEKVFASFRREARALARVRHPGVVRVLDHGVHEGFPWYAMELLEGTTLRNLTAAVGPTHSLSLRSTRSEERRVGKE